MAPCTLEEQHPTATKTDVLIVGGGVVGTSLAYSLLRLYAEAGEVARSLQNAVGVQPGRSFLGRSTSTFGTLGQGPDTASALTATASVLWSPFHAFLQLQSGPLRHCYRSPTGGVSKDLSNALAFGETAEAMATAPAPAIFGYTGLLFRQFGAVLRPQDTRGAHPGVTCAAGLPTVTLLDKESTGAGCTGLSAGTLFCPFDPARLKCGQYNCVADWANTLVHGTTQILRELDEDYPEAEAAGTPSSDADRKLGQDPAASDIGSRRELESLIPGGANPYLDFSGLSPTGGLTPGSLAQASSGRGTGDVDLGDKEASGPSTAQTAPGARTSWQQCGAYMFTCRSRGASAESFVRALYDVWESKRYAVDILEGPTALFDQVTRGLIEDDPDHAVAPLQNSWFRPDRLPAVTIYSPWSGAVDPAAFTQCLVDTCTDSLSVPNPAPRGEAQSGSWRAGAKFSLVEGQAAHVTGIKEAPEALSDSTATVAAGAGEGEVPTDPYRYYVKTATGREFITRELVLANGTGIPSLARQIHPELEVPIVPVRGRVWMTSTDGNDVAIVDKVEAGQGEQGAKVVRTARVPPFVFFGSDGLQSWSEHDSLDEDHLIPLNCNFDWNPLQRKISARTAARDDPDAVLRRSSGRNAMHLYGKVTHSVTDGRTWQMVGYDREPLHLAAERQRREASEKLRKRNDGRGASKANADAPTAELKEGENRLRRTESNGTDLDLDAEAKQPADEEEARLVKAVGRYLDRNCFDGFAEAALNRERDNNAAAQPTVSVVHDEGGWTGVMPFSLYGKPLVGNLGGLKEACKREKTEDEHAFANRHHLWIAGGFGPVGIKQSPMAMRLMANHMFFGIPSPVVARNLDPSADIRRYHHFVQERTI